MDKLKNVCSIKTGITFRETVVNDPHGDCLVIQPKNIKPGFRQFVSYPDKIKSDAIPEEMLLKKGDVIFLSKGSSNHAWLFNLEKKTVTSSLFIILRSDPTQNNVNKVVTPEYLCWWLNMACAPGGKLDRQKQGTSVTAIALDAIKELPIPVPSIAIQDKWMKLIDLWHDEREMTMALLKEKDGFINLALASAI